LKKKTEEEQAAFFELNELRHWCNRVVDWREELRRIQPLSSGMVVELSGQQFTIDNRGEINLGELGNLPVSGLTEKQADALVRAAFALLPKAKAQALKTFDERLRNFEHGLPADDNWQKLHEVYRRNQLRFSRNGSVLTVVVHSHPGGGLQFDWTVREPGPIPYRVVVYENGDAISSDYAHSGRLNRVLRRGHDYRFTFGVFDECAPRQRGEVRNLERGLLIVVNIPKSKVWYWKERNGATNADRIIADLKSKKAQRDSIEAEIDAMGLPADDAEYMKAQATAQLIERSCDS
jgi:hypothetical protein